MATESVVLHALELARVRDSHAGWALLRGDNAPVAAAILAAHLSQGDRRRGVVELTELVAADLDDLREAGLDLPRTASAYLTEWRTQGLLLRRAATDSRSETLELSPQALLGLRFLEDLRSPRQSATQSRLATIAEGLRALARDTDPDPTAQIAQLEQERERLDGRIAALRAGRSPQAVTAEGARERAADLLQLAEEIPADFARVREDLEGVNRALRESILDGEGNQGHVLAEVFRGVDLIATSPSGRTFEGFAELVLDAEAGASFADAVAQVLSREFARDLDPAQRRFLRDLQPSLVDASLEIQTVMAGFARSLRRFVHSQDYVAERVMRRELRGALADALPAARTTRPWADSGIELPLSSVRIASVGGLRLHDPDQVEVAGDVEVAPEAEVDLAVLRALARETEIDFAELREAVNAALAAADPPATALAEPASEPPHESAPQQAVTVAQVLDSHPASQGVASVVGLLALAVRHGEVAPEEHESLAWTSLAGVARSALVPTHRFTRRIP